MTEAEHDQTRILAADDESNTLALFRQILTDQKDEQMQACELKQLADKLYDAKTPDEYSATFDLRTCRQGREAVEAVRKALEENRPFAVAFLDVRMPPGPDGVWAAEQIRLLDPHVEIVMVTAYSDVHSGYIANRVPPAHKLLYLQKPFNLLEIYQFASALSAKWRLEIELDRMHAELERRIAERTVELENMNTALKERENDLKIKTSSLEEVNAALKILLKKRDEDKAELEEKVLSNVKELIMPYLEKVKHSALDDKIRSYVDVLESNLNEIVSPFARKLSFKYLSLTPAEIQVANLVKQGRTSKEMAVMLNVSTRTIEAHRKNIRNKIGIKNKKANLRTHLLSIQ